MAINDPIKNPSKIIESILRDEIFANRRLKVLSKVSDEEFEVDNDPKEAGYFTDSIITFSDKEIKIEDSAPTSLGNTLFMTNSEPISVDDKCYLSNIQATQKLDLDSFASTGGTGGSRVDWIFARSIYEKVDSETIISELLDESFMCLFRNPKYRIIDLDPIETPDGTFSNPLKDKGNPLISSAPTDVDKIYTSFKMKFGYDYIRGKFRYELSVDEKGNTSGYDTELSSFREDCKSARLNFKIIRPWNYESYWIYDYDTALKFFIRKIKNHTRVKQKFYYIGSPYDHAQYQEGDKVLLDIPDHVPEGVNNITQFIINGIMYQVTKGSPEIHFKLSELVSI